MPPLTIGMPIYNAENYLEQALNSVLASTYTDFKVMLVDNASTDSTESVSRDFAASDSRIDYYRHDRNLGAAANFNWVWDHAESEYFKIFAHDDLIRPTFLERCMDALEERPDYVLATSLVEGIDASGTSEGPVDEKLVRMDDPDPVVRFGHFITTRNRVTSLFGVVRRREMGTEVLLEPYVGSDRSLVAAWALAGRWYIVPEPLLLRRNHDDASTGRGKNEYDRLGWFDPARAGRIIFPTWRRLGGFKDVVDRSALDHGDRLRAYAQIAKWAVSPVYRPPMGRLLVRDPVKAAAMWARGARA